MKWSVSWVILSQWGGVVLWSGPSKAVRVNISAVPCKSTLILLVLIFTCYMTRALQNDWIPSVLL